MKTLTILSPVYREAEVIADFHRELAAATACLEDRYHVDFLYVVDPSDDDTVPILKRIAHDDPRVRVLVLSNRFGHQMALLAGFDHCDADAVVMLDSDLQHPPRVIPELVARFEDGNDVVVTVRQDSPDVGWVKRTTSRLFYRSIGRLTSVPIRESAADFRLLGRRVVEVFQRDLRERNQFVRGLVSWVGFRSTEVHFEADARHAGASKYTYSRMVRFAVDGIVSFSKRPLLACAGVGLLIGLFGLGYAALSLVLYAAGVSSPSGWTSLVVLLSLFSGTQLFFLGVVGIYIGSIFDEVKRRPHYLVDEKVNF